MGLNPLRTISDLTSMDSASEAISGLVQRVTADDRVQNALAGSWLGHKLHPMLTDIPLGAWLMASVLDLTAGEESAPAARRLVAVGILSAVPTAATGANDWSTTIGREQRIGLVHGLANAAATTLQVLSWVARTRGARSTGIALSTTGLGLALGSAYLGGHLTLQRGVGVNHTAFEEPAEDWIDVAAEEDVAEGAPVRVSADGVPVVLVRHQGAVAALSATCVHAGGPLDEGDVGADGTISCPWHGSRFRLADGCVVRGPASEPQPSWEVGVAEGRIRVRATQEG